MFRKLVSNLPFSPTLINELGFYAKRLRKEETTRRLGLILTALALMVQSFTVLSPPESANASSPSDIVHGGIHSKSQLLSAWDNNTQGFRDLVQDIGLDREDLAKTKEDEINTRTNGNDNGWLSWGRQSRGGVAYNETAERVGGQTVYVRSLASMDTGSNVRGRGSHYPSFVGTTPEGYEFVVLKGCGNIVLLDRPDLDRPTPPRPHTDKDIEICLLDTREVAIIKQSEYDPEIHYKDLSLCDYKPIEVCDLANKQMGTIYAEDFDPRRYSKNRADCEPEPTPEPEPEPKPEPKPQPAVNCSSLTIKRISRTEVDLQASANATNGASIKSYTYVIKDENGKEVLRRTLNTGTSTSSMKYTTENEGSYTAEVIVNTSLGDRTADVCKDTFIIEPIARCPLSPTLAINDPNCQPCVGDPTLWVKDDRCAAKVLLSKEAKNLTADADATLVLAKASDRIEYTLTARNDGKDVAEFDMEDNISDILEYANLYDRGDGKLNEQSKYLSWGKVRLEPGEQQKRTYVVQLASSISPRSQGSSDPTSYDCKMINVFGNTLEVNVDCPAPKIIEQVVVAELPRTGPTANVIIGGVTAAIVAFLYLRSRQLNKEVRLIRREVTAGTI